MKRVLHIVLVSCLLVGCGSLKQNWYNFTAYYNTFHNAKKYYAEGLEQNTRLMPEINPEIPIRVHLPPTSAGYEEFEHAIEKGASILRNHEQSKFVNPAIALIGRSYFYRLEFFAALEKFQELYAVASGEKLQEAVLWQGRTYLEVESISEGIGFLESEIEYIEGWSPRNLAETKIVLAQLYVAQRNWAAAEELLASSADQLQDRHLRARALFLYGQVLEQSDKYDEALLAYSRAGDIRTDYELEFHIARKEAEVSRSVGHYDRAIGLFRRMERDDKFIEHRIDLQYEIARTYQLQGDSEEALQLYNRVLENEIQLPTSLVLAKTYFGMGEIYRDDISNFRMAAAYFDSAAAQRVDDSLLPGNFNARELAVSFGEYASVKQEMTRLDSLLHLGMMEPLERDSVIAEIERNQHLEMEEEMRRMQRQQDRFITVEQLADSAMEASEATEFGFLNIRNQSMLADASLQFQGIWGDRPLGDHWRRRADIIGSRFEALVLSDGEVLQDGGGGQNSGGMLAQATIDVSEIPLTDEAQSGMRKDIENLHYRLGNVFFLSLNLPDSAKVYYTNVIESSLNEELLPRALYSLAEIDILEENFEGAMHWAEKLISEFPQSPYIGRLAERLDFPAQTIEQVPDTTRMIQRDYSAFMLTEDESGEDPAEKAMVLQELATHRAGDSYRPLLLYEAARQYMKAAQRASQDSTLLVEWLSEQEEWALNQRNFASLQDSARTMLSDTSLTENEHDYWREIADSTLSQPAFSSSFPFEGVWWDSTRSVLDHIENHYASSEVIPRVRILRQTLESPSQMNGQTPGLSTIDELAAEAGWPDDFPEEFLLCRQLGLEFDTEMGQDRADEFLESILSAAMHREEDEHTGSGAAPDSESFYRGMVYHVAIAPDGTVEDVERISDDPETDRNEMHEAIENAMMEQTLRFLPTGLQELVQCRLVFSMD